ncbi:hypothetical protein ACOSP7_005453 [Xanthoceras sorbifolium]
MGICSSTDITTAKLILHDGGLKEFSNPVRVSCVLEEDRSCFICNSDDMDFDKVLPAMDEDKELLLGELYFALPLSWLDSPLRAGDLASLAVKAGLALQLDGGGGGEKCFCKCGFKRIDQVIKLNSKRIECGEMETIGGRDRSPGGGSGGGCGGGCVGGRRGRIAAKLSVILEDEYDQNLQV